MHAKGERLAKILLGSTVTSAAFVLNRSPTKKLEDVTPEEAWSGCKPSVKTFQDFWVHLP